MREIKFRAWDKTAKKLRPVHHLNLPVFTPSSHQPIKKRIINPLDLTNKSKYNLFYEWLNLPFIRDVEEIKGVPIDVFEHALGLGQSHIGETKIYADPGYIKQLIVEWHQKELEKILTEVQPFLDKLISEHGETLRKLGEE